MSNLFTGMFQRGAYTVKLLDVTETPDVRGYYGFRVLYGRRVVTVMMFRDHARTKRLIKLMTNANGDFNPWRVACGLQYVPRWNSLRVERLAAPV